MEISTSWGFLVIHQNKLNYTVHLLNQINKSAFNISVLRKPSFLLQVKLFVNI